MRVSIITAILDSQEVVRRQMLHYKKLDLPDDVEIIFVDDGSKPPLEFPVELKNFRHFATNNFSNWTQPAARNFGVKQATGKYVICTDIDHILSKELIEFVYNTDYDIVRFRREVGVLDENGDFTQDEDVLVSYGFQMQRIRDKGRGIAPHGNSYAFRRKLYLELGGVSERYVGTGKYPNREEVPLKRVCHQLERDGKITILNGDGRPTIYMFPNGHYCGDINYNPFNLFHNTSRQRNIGRKTNKQKRRERRERTALLHKQ